MHSGPHISEVVLWFITNCSALSGLIRLQNTNINEAAMPDCIQQFLAEANSHVLQGALGHAQHNCLY